MQPKTNTRNAPWIGVDLDRTLAHYVTHDHGYDATRIGEPLWPMVHRIQHWIDAGTKVKIFTARVSGFDLSSVDGKAAKAIVVDAIQNWLENACKLPRLEVTNEKDYRTIEIWDDIAVQMHPNTGLPIVGPNR